MHNRYLTIRIDAPKEVSADGLAITIDGAVIKIDRKLMPGQRIIYQHNSLYLADAGRNKLLAFPVAKKLNLPKGRSTILVEALGQQDDKVKFELVVTAIGKGEKIGK